MQRGVVLGASLIVALWGEPLGPATGAASSETRTLSPSPAAPEQRSPPPRPQFVRDAQRALRDLGYRPGPIDGTVGPRMRAALTRYQRNENLPVTGELDAETMVRLDIHERLFGDLRSKNRAATAATPRRAP